MFLKLFSDAFHKEPVEIDLVFACVGEMNTTIRGGLAWPIVYGVGKISSVICYRIISHLSICKLGFNVKTGELFNATFPDKGPDMALRSARQLTGSSHVIRHSSETKQIRKYLNFP